MSADQPKESAPVEWVCPWGICPPKQAQECRAPAERSRDSCHRRFPPGTTLEQAKQQIGPRHD